MVCVRERGGQGRGREKRKEGEGERERGCVSVCLSEQYRLLLGNLKILPWPYFLSDVPGPLLGAVTFSLHMGICLTVLIDYPLKRIFSEFRDGLLSMDFSKNPRQLNS